jgi:hypothetical protein
MTKRSRSHFNILLCNGTVLVVTLLTLFVASPVPAIPPEPDNAALLYYQSFLELAELSKEARTRFGYTGPGHRVPDDEVREDVCKCKEAIEFAEEAVEMPTCHWGVRYPKEFKAPMAIAQMRLLAYVLLTDARIHAADGDYKAALERCLMTGKFARHVGDDTFTLYLVSTAFKELEYRCMQDIIGKASGDTELLQWLKDKLANSDAKTVSLVRPLKFDIELMDDLIRIDNVKKFTRLLADSGEKEIARIVQAADKNTLERARQKCVERLNSAMTILNTPMPYEEAYSQLKRLSDDFDIHNPASWLDGKYMPALHAMVSYETRAETHANAIRTAIEILLSRAGTGELPDALPSGLPKDAFSDKDFEYEKTEEGFVLRCRAKDLNKDMTNQYEFKIPR